MPKSYYRNYQKKVLRLSDECIKDQEMQLKRIAVNVVKSNVDELKKMRNSFVMIGLDIIVDVSYKLWLCKINSSSAIGFSNVV